ncbi:hypothetical protein TCON_2712, partial [Astathelohania contejeani]
MKLYEYINIFFRAILQYISKYNSLLSIIFDTAVNSNNNYDVYVEYKAFRIELLKTGTKILEYYNNASDPCLQTSSFSQAIKDSLLIDIYDMRFYLQEISENMIRYSINFKFKYIEILILKRLLLSFDTEVVNYTLNLIYYNINIFLNNEFQNIKINFINEFLIIKDILYKRYNYISSNINDTTKSYYNMKLSLINSIDDYTIKYYVSNICTEEKNDEKFFKIFNNNVKLRNLVIIQIISIKLMFNDADDARTDITELPIQLLYSFKEISNLISCDI